MTLKDAFIAVACLGVACLFPDPFSINVILLYPLLFVLYASKCLLPSPPSQTNRVKKWLCLGALLFIAYLIVTLFQPALPQPHHLARMMFSSPHCKGCPGLKLLPPIHKVADEEEHNREFRRLHQRGNELWGRCFAGAGRFYERALQMEGAADVPTLLATRLSGPFQDSLLPVLWPIVASYLAPNDEAEPVSDGIARDKLADVLWGAAAGRHAQGDFRGAQVFWRRAFTLFAPIVVVVSSDDETKPLIATTEPESILVPSTPASPRLPQFIQINPSQFYRWATRGFLAGGDPVRSEWAARLGLENYVNPDGKRAELLLFRAASLLLLGREKEARLMVEQGIRILTTEEVVNVSDSPCLDRLIQLQMRMSAGNPITGNESKEICRAFQLSDFRVSRCTQQKQE
jgi:hypothetical protein